MNNYIIEINEHSSNTKDDIEINKFNVNNYKEEENIFQKKSFIDK